MYLVAIGWIYVVLMMAVVEAMSSQGTLLGACVTFVLYGLLRHFVMRRRADGSQRWLADLQGLARDVLLQLGLVDISADPACTVQDSSRFFSFRRSGVTGRHACSVWLR